MQSLRLFKLSRSVAVVGKQQTRQLSFSKRMSEFSKRKFDDDNWTYQYDDHIPKTRERLHFPMSDASLEKLSKETGVPAELIEDGNYHLLMLKARTLFETLNVPVEKEKEFVEANSISPGWPSLEWAMPSPPPLHTFEELPLIKVVTEGGDSGKAHH